MMRKQTKYLSAVAIVFYCLFPVIAAYSQTGISVSPPRTYFILAPGQTESKKILVSNPSKVNTLNLAVTLNDWEYDQSGNNLVQDAGTLKNSCTSWMNILPQTFFSLGPGQSHEIEVQLNVPKIIQDSLSVHTAMLYVTQLNPIDDINEKGANIKVAVRSGVKIYHYFDTKRKPDVEIENFAFHKADVNHLKFTFRNTGNIWLDGTITCDLLNQETGKKIKLDDIVFYSLPGNLRDVYFKLPDNLPSAKYIATALVNYDDASSVKLAELEFNYGK